MVYVIMSWLGKLAINLIIPKISLLSICSFLIPHIIEPHVTMLLVSG